MVFSAVEDVVEVAAEEGEGGWLTCDGGEGVGEGGDEGGEEG